MRNSTTALFTILFLTFSSAAFCQNENSAQIDTLVFVRKIFHTNVYDKSVLLSKSRFSSKLAGSRKWSRRNTVANFLIPGGPVIAVGGVYLAYDAIKGIPMVAVIDGKEYPYVKRNLPELLSGLAIFVTGLSLMESGNETKMNATLWHNNDLKKKAAAQQTSFELKAGFTRSGGIGFSANF